MIIHPRYVFGAIDPSEYELYKVKNRLRARQTYKAMSEMMITNKLVRVKDAPPYTKDLEQSVLMNPLARATFDPKTGSYAYKSKLNSTLALNVDNVATVSKVLENNRSTAGIGVDQGTYTPCFSSSVSLNNFPQQSSSRPCPHRTSISSRATSPTPRSRTARHNPAPLHRSLVDGLVKRLSSSLSESPRVEQQRP